MLWKTHLPKKGVLQKCFSGWLLSFLHCRCICKRHPNNRLRRLFGDCFAFARNDENGCLKTIDLINAYRRCWWVGNPPYGSSRLVRSS
ncbi:MAG: hypothetical protein J5680_03555 [Neisseriaceae bacterium]|nr:hypothetical protein [Neisseriaceae bacterium]